MKKIIFILFACFIAFSTSAQDVANSFLEKYGKDDNLEIVSIGKKMFQQMEKLTSEEPELTEAIKGLENILIISSNDSALNKEYYDSAYEILTRKKQGFEPLLTLKENDQNVIVMIKESKKGIVKELVMLSGDNNQEFNMISLSGKIDLKLLLKYSDKINLSGLKVLNSVNKN